MEPCECAMTIHHGGYSTLSEAYGAVVSWISENGYEITGASFDLYIKTQFDSDRRKIGRQKYTSGTENNAGNKHTL